MEVYVIRLNCDEWSEIIGVSSDLDRTRVEIQKMIKVDKVLTTEIIIDDHHDISFHRFTIGSELDMSWVTDECGCESVDIESEM